MRGNMTAFGVLGQGFFRLYWSLLEAGPRQSTVCSSRAVGWWPPGSSNARDRGRRQCLLHALGRIPDALQLADVEDLANVVGVVRSHVGDRDALAASFASSADSTAFSQSARTWLSFFTRSSHCAGVKLSKVSLLFPSKGAGFSPLNGSGRGRPNTRGGRRAGRRSGCPCRAPHGLLGGEALQPRCSRGQTSLRDRGWCGVAQAGRRAGWWAGPGFAQKRLRAWRGRR